MKIRKAINPASIHYVGPSSDYQTNKWRVVCECGHYYYPQTTLMSSQHTTCDKCLREYFIDYNHTPNPLIKNIGGANE